MKEQITINSLEFAQKSHSIRGTIAPRDLERLQDMLFSNDGSLNYQLQGGINAQGKPELRLALEGELMLACQRCMGGLKHRVDSVSRLVIVSGEEMMPAPDDEQDDEDFLVADPRFDVVALIEDEILLGLPMAPLHDTAECGANAVAATEKRESPFKVLQGLKLDKS